MVAKPSTSGLGADSPSIPPGTRHVGGISVIPPVISSSWLASQIYEITARLNRRLC